MKQETIRTLIADGRLTQNGYDYIGKDGRGYHRVTIYGRRGHAVDKWQRDGDPFLYRSLMECYYGTQY